MRDDTLDLLQLLAWLDHKGALDAFEVAYVSFDLDLELGLADGSIEAPFVWCKTIEGHDYWRDLDKEWEAIRYEI